MSRFKPNTTASTVLEKRPAQRQRTEITPSPSSSEESELTAAAEPSLSSAGKIALYLVMAFIFLRFSFLHELLMNKIGFDSHLLLLVGGFAVLGALLAGGLFNGVSNKIALAWFGFTACMVMATVTSTWHGGSFNVLYPYLRTTLILVVLIPAVALTTKSLSLVLNTIGLAGLVTLIFGLTVNDFRTGRLELSGAGASIENSNDYAALLILVTPAIAYLTMRRGSAFVLKVVGFIALGVSCFLVLSTGSRGALISLLISGLYVLKAGSARIRIALLVGVPLVALIAIPFLPAEASQRLSTVFNSSAETGEAADSKEQRSALLMASLRITAEHPLLGVGPGTFSENEAEDANARGVRGMWHETHNSFTQISSECGIPALLFYLAAIFLSLRVFRKGRKSPDPEIRAISSIFGLTVVSFAAAMFFLSQGYGFGFPVLGGLAISLERLMARQLEPAAD